MEGDLPYWLKASAAFATIAIAFLGFCIAWGQYITARSKLALDLFEKRDAVFTELHQPVGRAMRTGQADTALWLEFMRGMDRARSCLVVK